MITLETYLVLLLLAVMGLIFTMYGDTKNELFCIYTGIGIEIITALLLIFTIIRQCN